MMNIQTYYQKNINKDLYIMTLKEQLEKFEGSANIDNLTNKFKVDLAPAILYGGYYNVDYKYRIYIRTIEFYYHSENNSGIKDPIVYHRNDNYVKGKVPYFPLMSLHAHISGLDITFENEEKGFRASALIRAYEVYDVERKDFLIYDTQKRKFLPWKEVQESNKGKVIKKYNKQSTYLYYFLNGFSSNSISWVDHSFSNTKQPVQRPRKNVYKFNPSPNSENQYEFYKDEKIKDERKWSFTREDDIIIEQ